MNVIKLSLFLAFMSGQLFLSAGLAGNDDVLKTQAEAWLDDHNDSGLVLVEKFDGGGFEGRQVVGSGARQYNLTDAGYRITLGFSTGFSDQSSLEEVREKFKYVALDRLPMPGFEVPDGWDVYPQTPVSSFKKGVEILDFRNGRMVLRIKTSFFAIYGRDTTVLVPADAPSPEGSYFQIRKPFPLDLTIDTPIGMND